MSRCKKKAAEPVKAGPEGILPLTDFRGDPWGTGNPSAVSFRAGVMSSPVPAEFAQQMRDEGKAARRYLRVQTEIMPDGEIRKVGRYFTDEPIASDASQDPSDA